MGGVPSELAKAKQLAVYWDNYINYISNAENQQPNIGQGKPKPPQTPLFIKPFGKELATTQYLDVNGTAARWNAFKASLTGYTKETLAAGDSSLNLREVTPARIVIKVDISTTPQVKTAATTKRKYVTYGGTAGSIPFGRKTAGESEVDAFETIKADVITSNAFQATTMRVSRIKEKA